MLQKEQIEQINFMNWVRENYPSVWDDTYHFANERKCAPWQGKTLKKMGVKSGVADIFVAVPRLQYHGLWIELKAEGGRLSKEQKEFLARSTKRGYLAMAVWGCEAAQAVFKSYFGISPEDLALNPVT